MANKSIILDVGLCKDIKLKDLEKIGYYKHPDEYITELTKCLIYIDPILQLESADKGFFFEISKQDFPIEIEGKKFFVFRICNPIPSDKKEKPSGLVIENDLSFLQFKEILLYDYIEKIMYCFEYSYHYGVWDYETNIETYCFRYDRDLLLKNPPKKNIVHLHVIKDKPHFDSITVNLKYIIDFLCNNWDTHKDILSI